MFSHINFGQSRTVGSSAAYIFANIKFHDFPGPGQKCHDFPGLESKLSNSMTFQVFQDRYEPCHSLVSCCRSSYFTNVFVADGERAGTVMIARWRSMLCVRVPKRINPNNNPNADPNPKPNPDPKPKHNPNVPNILFNRNPVATYRHHRHFVVFNRPPRYMLLRTAPYLFSACAYQ